MSSGAAASWSRVAPAARSLPASSALMAEGDADRLRSAYEAFNEGGVDAILERLDPEIHVQERETLPDRATYRGREGVRQMFQVILEAFDDFHFEVEDVVDRE